MDSLALVQALDRAEEEAQWNRWTRLRQRPVQLSVGKLVKAVNRVPALPDLAATATPFYGGRLEVYPPETVSERLLRFRFFEPELTRMVCRLVRPGYRVFDVGAHLGYFTALFARLVGESGEVVAFEPTPTTRRVLQRNVSGMPQVSVRPEAAWSASGELPLSDYGPVWSSFNSAFTARTALPAGRRFTAPTVPLDVVASEVGGPDFVKIDAESAEAEILTGMTRIISEARPIVSVEVGDVGLPGVASSRDVLTLLTDRDYAPVVLDGSDFVETSVHASYGYDNAVMVPCERLKDVVG